MKIVKSNGGTYVIKLIKRRWYHNIFKSRQGIAISDISLKIKVDEKGKLFIDECFSIGARRMGI
jgi:hypothetical protein